MASISRISLRMIFGSFERCTECAILTPAALTTCFATSLSNARAEASAPGPVKAMRRASSMRWMVPSSPSPPWSARRYTREGWLSNAATTDGNSAARAGRKSRSKGRWNPASSSRVTRWTAPDGARNQASASSSTAETFCADATDTRRSLLVPPKRMVTSEPDIERERSIARARAQR